MKLYQYALLMRSAGCVINDYADRNIDPHVKRTRERPLAAKRVTEKEALILFAILCLIAFGLVLLINALIWDFQYQWHLLHKPAKFP